MRLWTGLVHRSGCQPLRRALFASLVLIMALAGGGSLRQANAQLERMYVDFSPSTPPVQPGVICKDQDYQILVKPLLTNVGEGQRPVIGSIVVSLTQPGLGTLNGATQPTQRNTTVGGSAVFTYKAQRTGREILNFGWVQSFPPTFQRDYPNPSYEDIEGQLIIHGDTDFRFEVRECMYKVIFESRYQFHQGNVSADNFGLMAETQLERKEDGTFAGNGTFVITNLVTSEICTMSYSDAEIPITITGKLLPDSGELELTFVYSEGTYITDASCPRAAAVTTSSLDISGIAPDTMKTPQSGGAKLIPLPGPGRGYLAITVKQVAQ
jgi:hypothetical protein